MRKLEKPKLKNYFSLSKIFQGRDAFIHYEIQNFNKLTSLIFLLIGLTVAGLFENKLFVFPITIFSYLLIVYIHTYIIARSIFVRRKVSDKAKENEVLSVEYLLRNDSIFTLTDFLLYDKFSGSSDKTSVRQIDEKIKARSSSKLIIKYPLNEGFGEHFFECITISISDTLGLFKFNIQTQKKKKILVFPKIQTFTKQSLSNNDETYLSGDFEIHKKGISPNFYGIRTYQFGDPMKFINWKLSGKLNELVINEYENAVNLKVNYILNFDKKSHVGKGVNSTWEYCRDLCLALAKKDIDKNHFVEVFSNKFHIEKGSGKKHFELMELKMCYLIPVQDDGDELLAKKINQMEKGSALIFITPLNQGPGLQGNIDFIKKHSDYFSEIHIYIIDAFEVTKSMAPVEYMGEILKFQKYSKDFFESKILPLRNLGVKIFEIEVKKPHVLQEQVSYQVGDRSFER